MLINQKSRTERAFDNSTRLNDIADITAEQKAIAKLSKLFPRTLLRRMSQQEKIL